MALRSTRFAITGFFLLIGLVIAWAAFVSDEQLTSRVTKIFPSSVETDSDQPPFLFIYREKHGLSVGDPVEYTFSLSNQYTSASLTLNGFPQRINSEWQNGSLSVDFDGFELHENTAEEYSFDAVTIGSGKTATGRFKLDEFGKITRPGRGSVQLNLVGLDSSGKELNIASNNNSLEIVALPDWVKGENGPTILAVATALESYFVWNSEYPPARQGKPVPLLPSQLTSPIAYLSATQAKHAKSLAIVTTRSAYCVAGQGPDKKWDIIPMIEKYKWPELEWEDALKKINEFNGFRYDPTNGLNSEGDELITRHDMLQLSRQTRP